MNATAGIRLLPKSQYEQLETRFDSEYGVYWALMNSMPRPCFTPQLLLEIRAFIDSIVNTQANIFHKGQNHPINYAVLASKVSGIYSLGGDLALFQSAIIHQDRDQLVQYGRMCVDDLLPWHRSYDLPVTTIALIQGSALGGGFEAALASSVLIAEESSRMGFPEILFNLFPGMGAYSFLSRKVGRRITEELITSGNTYTARQLLDLGVVDVITPDGTGEAAVYSYIRKHSKASNGRRAIEQVRRDFDPITRKELDQVVEIWVDAALRLTERDLKMMSRLVRGQHRTLLEDSIVEVPAPALPVSEARCEAFAAAD